MASVSFAVVVRCRGRAVVSRAPGSDPRGRACRGLAIERPGRFRRGEGSCL